MCLRSTTKKSNRCHESSILQTVTIVWVKMRFFEVYAAIIVLLLVVDLPCISGVTKSRQLRKTNDPSEKNVSAGGENGKQYDTGSTESARHDTTTTRIVGSENRQANDNSFDDNTAKALAERHDTPPEERNVVGDSIFPPFGSNNIFDREAGPVDDEGNLIEITEHKVSRCVFSSLQL
jgi:hypothetical protein